MSVRALKQILYYVKLGVSTDISEPRPDVEAHGLSHVAIWGRMPSDSLKKEVLHLHVFISVRTELPRRKKVQCESPKAN